MAANTVKVAGKMYLCTKITAIFYYLQKDSGMELDFLGVKHFIKFGDYNIGRDGDLLTLPTYMQFLLDLEPEAVTLERIDTEELTRLAKEILGK